MAYPSIISVISNPQATDRLNNPSHSTIHQNENTAITEIETFVGTLSSTVGTLVYDIRAAASNGGGHVQTANKGGTGQITYNKGDLLIASSSSVLSRLAIGADNQVLQADSSQALGVKWSAVIANKIAVQSSTVGFTITGSVFTLFNASVIGSTLGTNNAIRFTAGFSNLTLSGSKIVQFSVNYGGGQILSLNGTAAAAGTSALQGIISGTIVANGSQSLQKSVGEIVFASAGGENAGDANVGVTKFMVTNYGTSSVESSANQNLSITAILTGANSTNTIVGEFIVVEKVI